MYDRNYNFVSLVKFPIVNGISPVNPEVVISLYFS